MIKVGIIGFGFMGRIHYNCWKAVEGAEIKAICSANPNLVDEIDFDRMEVYSDFDEMIKKANLDAISITLPTFLHKDFSIKALNTGLHVLCEKPMALNSVDCEEMKVAAESTGKLLQIGHCIRFWPEYVKAKEIIDSGKYGKVKAGTFQRLSATPTWSKDGWLIDEKRSGGVGLDLHIHDTDYVQHLLGMPKAVNTVCSLNQAGQQLHMSTQYIYDGNTAITAEGSWAMMPSFGFEMSFNIVLEKATLVFDCTRDPAFKICPNEGDAFTPEVEAGDGWLNEIIHFGKAVAGEDVPEVLTLEQSCNSVKIIEAEVESAKKGEKVIIEGGLVKGVGFDCLQLGMGSGLTP